MARLTLHTLALCVGFSGAVAALIIDMLRSLFHVLGNTAGFSDDSSHFFFGLLVVMAGFVGLLLGPPSPVVAALLLVGAGITFFFIVGWWALLASPFLLFAAVLLFRNQKVSQPVPAETRLARFLQARISAYQRLKTIQHERSRRMAQANQPGRGLERFTFRTIALIVGLVGTVLAFIINLLYSLFHVLGRVTGITNDASHFWWGLLVVILALIGSFIAPVFPIGAAILLLGTGIAFFFVVGWWAIIASVFLIVAAVLTISNRKVRVPGMAS